MNLNERVYPTTTTASGKGSKVPMWLAAMLTHVVGEFAPAAPSMQPVARLVREYSVRLDSRTMPVEPRKYKGRRTKRGFFTFN